MESISEPDVKFLQAFMSSLLGVLSYSCQVSGKIPDDFDRVWLEAKCIWN